MDFTEVAGGLSVQMDLVCFCLVFSTAVSFPDVFFVDEASLVTGVVYPVALRDKSVTYCI